MPWIRTFGERPPGTLVALVGYSERLEIGIVEGSAKELFGNQPLTVMLRLATTTEDVDTISTMRRLVGRADRDNR